MILNIKNIKTKFCTFCYIVIQRNKLKQLSIVVKSLANNDSCELTMIVQFAFGARNRICTIISF